MCVCMRMGVCMCVYVYVCVSVCLSVTMLAIAYLICISKEVKCLGVPCTRMGLFKFFFYLLKMVLFRSYLPATKIDNLALF